MTQSKGVSEHVDIPLKSDGLEEAAGALRESVPGVWGRVGGAGAGKPRGFRMVSRKGLGTCYWYTGLTGGWQIHSHF